MKSLVPFLKKNDNLKFFFLCELRLILRIDRKRENELEIFARGPQISNVNQIGQLVQALHQATSRRLKTIFLVSGIFSGKADSVILLGFECTINLENLIKIVGEIFEEIKILFFISCELPLILGVEGKLKKARDICKRTLDIEFEQDWSVGLGITLGDRQEIKKYFSSFRDFSE